MLIKIFTMAAALFALTLNCQAQEATIRKNLMERIPQLQKIEEVNKTGMAGLYEIRVHGNEIYYTDSEANFLFQGNLIDTRQKRNLTEERVEKLLLVNFDSLPLKDAITVVRGTGKRKLAVFEDPNCGYCKRFEKDLETINNITIHTFLYPVLGPDSFDKSKNIWCAKDRAKAWQDWMLRQQSPASLGCDSSAINRNAEFGKKHKITGTPTLIFADGSRVPGAINAQQIEKHLSDIK